MGESKSKTAGFLEKQYIFEDDQKQATSRSIVKRAKKSERKQKQTKNIIDNLEGKFLLVNVGTPAIPATDEQIQEIEGHINKILKNNNISCSVLVTHHAVKITVVE